MAKSKNNVVTYGLSGKVGDLLVFRQRDGQTVVAKVPQASKKVSESQKAHRKRFQQAVIYATAAVKSPETGELYRAATKKGQVPVNVAVADFFDAPDIEQIDLSGYAGATGDVIRVAASDDFMVKSVNVKIVNTEGELEEGEAVQDAGMWWIYTTTRDNNSVETSKIIVSVSDIPGNLTVEEVSK